MSLVLERKRHDAKRQYLALKAKFEELEEILVDMRTDLERSRAAEVTLNKRRMQLLQQLVAYEGRKRLTGEDAVSRSGRWRRCSILRANGEPCGNPTRIPRAARNNPTALQQPVKCPLCKQEGR